MIIMKEGVYTHRSLERGGMAYPAGPHREAPRSVKRQKGRGENGPEQNLFWGFQRKEWVRQGR